MAQTALEDILDWWELITRLRLTDPNVIPSWLVNMPIAVGWMWGSNASDATEIPTDYSCDKLGPNGW